EVQALRIVRFFLRPEDELRAGRPGGRTADQAAVPHRLPLLGARGVDEIELELAAAFIDERDALSVRRPAGAARPALVRLLQDLFGHAFDDVVDVDGLIAFVAADVEDATAVRRKGGGGPGKDPLPALAVGVHYPHAGLRFFRILVGNAEHDLPVVGRPGGQGAR